MSKSKGLPISTSVRHDTLEEYDMNWTKNALTRDWAIPAILLPPNYNSATALVLFLLPYFKPKPRNCDLVVAIDKKATKLSISQVFQPVKRGFRAHRCPSHSQHFLVRWRNQEPP